MKTYPICELEFDLKSLSYIQFPRFPEGVIRGAFGSVFRSLVCAQKLRSKCNGCMLYHTCAFSVVFSPGAEEKDQNLKNNESIPRPYLLQMDVPGKYPYEPQQTVRVKMLLIGKCIQYYPYILLSFIEMGKRGIGLNRFEGQTGKFEISTIFENMADGSKRLLYDRTRPKYSVQPMGYVLADNFDLDHPQVTDCTIFLDSPMRIKQDRKLVQEIPFFLLIKSIILRNNALSYHFGDGTIERHEKEFWSTSKEVFTTSSILDFVDYKWHSKNNPQGINLGGLTGQLSYHGNLTPFVPYLRLAEKICVGKNTTFGFGRIRIALERRDIK